MTSINIGEKLRNLRRSAKKTLKEMSKILGVSLNTVYRWEHGLSIPRKSVLKKMAGYYSVPFEWLLYGNVGDDDIILNSEAGIEERIMDMIRGLTEQSKYRVMGYIECVRNEYIKTEE